VRLKAGLSYIYISIALLLFFAGQSFSQTVLDFPRVISNSGVLTGIAVSNPTSADTSVTFTAFQPDGTTVIGTGVTNPVTNVIPAGGQIALQFAQIFGGAADFNGWVQASSNTTGLTGFFVNGNPSNTDLSGAATIQPASSFVLPFANENTLAVTEVTIVNINADASQVTLTLYDPTGATIATTIVSLPGMGFFDKR